MGGGGKLPVMGIEILTRSLGAVRVLCTNRETPLCKFNDASAANLHFLTERERRRRRNAQICEMCDPKSL